MAKRKAGSESEKWSNKKLKAEGGPGQSLTSKLSFDSPEQCFSSLIYPTTVEEFFADSWEKQPMFVQRKDANYYGELLTKANFEDIVKKTKLEFEDDVIVARYSQEKGLIQVEGKATAKSIRKYFEDEKATIILSRPHRFHKELHHLFQLLESYFGSCSYARLEITPGDSQGLAPCYTCKEEFILQVEGKGHWRLYKPLKELANEDSDDLDESEIGEVIHECEMEPGDLLYFPRGTVFQLASSSDKYSTHLSVQFYDNNTWGHFLSAIIDRAVTHALENDVSFREGLPLNFLSYIGSEKKELTSEALHPSGKTETSQKGKVVIPELERSYVDKQKVFQELLKEKFVSLAQYLDPHRGGDSFGKWFIHERLPPFTQSDVTPGDGPDNKTPEDDTLVQMNFPDHVRIVLHEPGDDWDEDDKEEDLEDLSEDEEDEDNDCNLKEEDDQKKSGKKKDKGSRANDKGEKNSPKSDLRSKIKTKKEAEKDECEEEEDEAVEEGDKSEELDGKFEDESCVVVQHSLHNGSDESTEKEPGLIKFPAHFYNALLILHRSKKSVAVKDLPLPCEERVELVVTLWTEGLLEVKEP